MATEPTAQNEDDESIDRIAHLFLLGCAMIAIDQNECFDAKEWVKNVSAAAAAIYEEWKETGIME